MASKTQRETAPTLARAGIPRRSLGPVALLAALAAALLALAPLASAATTASSASTLLPPKPTLSVQGGGDDDDEGEDDEEDDDDEDGGATRIARSTTPLGGGASLGGSASTGATRTAGSTAAVKTIQASLKRLGYFAGPVNGVYGPQTIAAVKRFQQRNRLAADGKWGPASQSMLVRRSAGK